MGLLLTLAAGLIGPPRKHTEAELAHEQAISDHVLRSRAGKIAIASMVAPVALAFVVDGQLASVILIVGFVLAWVAVMGGRANARDELQRKGKR